MLRNGGEVLCAICHLPCTLTKFPQLGQLTIDHIIPKNLGGTTRRSNLQPAHARCNSYKGDELVYLFHDKHALRIFKAYAEIKDSLRHRWHPPLQLHGHLSRLASTYGVVGASTEQVVQKHRTPRLEWGWFELCLELHKNARLGAADNRGEVPLEVRELALRHRNRRPTGI